MPPVTTHTCIIILAMYCIMNCWKLLSKPNLQSTVEATKCINQKYITLWPAGASNACRYLNCYIPKALPVKYQITAHRPWHVAKQVLPLYWLQRIASHGVHMMEPFVPIQADTLANCCITVTQAKSEPRLACQQTRVAILQTTSSPTSYKLQSLFGIRLFQTFEIRDAFFVLLKYRLPSQYLSYFITWLLYIGS